MNLLYSLLAQNGTAPTQTPSGPSASAALFPIALMGGLIVFMILTARSQKRREQRQREEMLSQLAKNKRVLTIGGIIGTIISLKDDEVLLKVDESTNTKMTFTKTAIQRVLSDG